MFENLTSQGAMPSLNGLRAFEAMGRTGGATLAAAELNVTHSAISRQVKALEAAMGVRLFEGPRHRLVLTEAGRTLLPALTQAFDGLAAAVSRARGEGADLQVAVNASLSVKWLIPRLSDFTARHPEVRLHLNELAPQAVTHRGADLMLRFMPDDQARVLGARRIMVNAIGPVIAPRLAGDDAEAATLGAPRLVARTHPSGWSDWLTLAGRPNAQRPPERIMAHIHFALDAAAAGWGAAVVPWTLAAEEVRAGRLTAPFGFLPDGGALVAIEGPGEPSRARRAFVRWLVRQGEEASPFPTA